MKKSHPSSKKPFERHIVTLQQEWMWVGQAFHNFLDLTVNWLMFQDKMCDHFETYAKMLADLIWIMEESAQKSDHKIADDYLWEFYMQFVSQWEQGQFFTPQHVSDMMTQLTMLDVEDDVKVSVIDPGWCWSGRMLLAAAKAKGKRNIHVTGVDLDARCCKMAVINLALNGIDGEIYHKNGLTDDYYWWRTIRMRPYPQIKFIPEIPDHIKLRVIQAQAQAKEQQSSQLSLF